MDTTKRRNENNTLLIELFYRCYANMLGGERRMIVLGRLERGSWSGGVVVVCYCTGCMGASRCGETLSLRVHELPEYRNQHRTTPLQTELRPTFWA